MAAKVGRPPAKDSVNWERAEDIRAFADELEELVNRTQSLNRRLLKFAVSINYPFLNTKR